MMETTKDIALLFFRILRTMKKRGSQNIQEILPFGVFESAPLLLQEPMECSVWQTFVKKVLVW
jgi:hypothetical protein